MVWLTRCEQPACLHYRHVGPMLKTTRRNIGETIFHCARWSYRNPVPQMFCPTCKVTKHWDVPWFAQLEVSRGPRGPDAAGCSWNRLNGFTGSKRVSKVGVGRSLFMQSCQRQGKIRNCRFMTSWEFQGTLMQLVSCFFDGGYGFVWK